MHSRFICKPAVSTQRARTRMGCAAWWMYCDTLSFLVLQAAAPGLAVPTGTVCVAAGVSWMLQTCVQQQHTWLVRAWWTLNGCALTAAVQGAIPHWQHWLSGGMGAPCNIWRPAAGMSYQGNLASIQGVCIALFLQIAGGGLLV